MLHTVVSFTLVSSCILHHKLRFITFSNCLLLSSQSECFLAARSFTITENENALKRLIKSIKSTCSLHFSDKALGKKFRVLKFQYALDLVPKALSWHPCPQRFFVSIIQILRNRGPNLEETIQINNLLLCGFVLWHQGNEICKQPLLSDNYALLFNGDIFNADESFMRSDTEWLFEKFSECSNENDLINCFQNIEGPFSIIFLDKRKQTIYFGRDSFGRNSLLLETGQQHIRLLSTSTNREKNAKTIELPPLGIYKMCLDNPKIFNVYPWEAPDEYWFNQAKYLENECQIKIAAQTAIAPQWLKLHENKYSFNFYDIQLYNNLSTKIYDNFLKNEEILMALDTFSLYLENSVKKRVQETTKWCALCMPLQTPCNHSKIAVLFSGGIDCSILAILADKHVPKSEPIDLINVAFQATQDNWNVPDRVSAKSTLTNLEQLCPYRKWNFIEVDITREKLYNQLDRHIKHLIFPLNTVLDESIGCAFWFAANCDKAGSLASCARVVILGSGADELFGGYVRHKNAYKRCLGSSKDKNNNLQKELELDWKKLPSRNLARDDRVISDNGKTPRTPFIEENVVNFVRSLKSYQRCCFLYEDGIGDKLFLRLYGYMLGLRSPVFLKKRAIQFGSRIANKKQNAKDISKYLDG